MMKKVLNILVIFNQVTQAYNKQKRKFTIITAYTSTNNTRRLWINKIKNI